MTLELMISRDGGPNGLRVAHHLNSQGRSLCCDKFGEIYFYAGFDTVVMCGACVVAKETISNEIPPAPEVILTQPKD